jgi:hypothetical protein
VCERTHLSLHNTAQWDLSLSLSLGGGWAHKEVNRMLHNEVCWDLTLGVIRILTS